MITNNTLIIIYHVYEDDKHDIKVKNVSFNIKVKDESLNDTFLKLKLMIEGIKVPSCEGAERLTYLTIVGSMVEAGYKVGEIGGRYNYVEVNIDEDKPYSNIWLTAHAPNEQGAMCPSAPLHEANWSII